MRTVGFIKSSKENEKRVAITLDDIDNVVNKSKWKS